MHTTDYQTQIEHAVSTEVIKLQQNESQLAGECHQGEGQHHQQRSKSLEEANRGFQENDLEFLKQMQLFDHQRTSIARHIESEEKKRKCYYDQIDMITRKIRSLPVIDEQPDITRTHLECEISQLRKIMLENFGTNEQFQQRRDAQMHRIHQLMQQKQAIHMEGKGFGGLLSSSDTIHSSCCRTCNQNDEQGTMIQSEENHCEQHPIPGAIYNGTWPKVSTYVPINPHPVQAVEKLVKLSFDERHRHAICAYGGLRAIADILEIYSNVNPDTDDQYSITMRRYACMALTNLTFGDGTNKALLCSMKSSMEALVSQLLSANEELCQVAASVLRNLSWKADLASKKTLREVGAVTLLMQASMRVEKESTLKSILSALWNLSAHCSENKADICAVERALNFLISILQYKSPSKTTTIIENGGGILRNVSSHIAVREDYRQILRQYGCLHILLKHLHSTSLTIVSNACGALWKLSAGCAEDQQALWEMGAVGMLCNLVNSKHKMISMGSSAALQNLLAARPAVKNMEVNKQANTYRPDLHARKQRALDLEIDQHLSVTCKNNESPRNNPVRSKKTGVNFVYPVYPVQDNCHISVLRNQVLPHSQSGDYALCATQYQENNMQCVARSESRDNVGSTHCHISHDRSHNASGDKGPMIQVNMEGSLDGNKETLTNHCGQGQKIQFDGRTERSLLGVPNSRIDELSYDCDSSVFKAPIPVSNQSLGLLSHPAPQQQSRNSSFASHLYGTPQQTLPYHMYMMTNIPQASNASHLNITSHPSQRNHNDDDDKPLDYSVKCHEGTSVGDSMLSQSFPNQPIMGNSGKKQMNQNAPAHLNNSQVQNPCFNSQAVNNNRFGCHSAYAETDLDDPDQTTDYSTQYDTDYNTEQCNIINYGASYNGNDPNCAYCKLEEARQCNDMLEQTICDDQIKTFCTEDTPDLSTATSLTDLIALKILEEAKEQYPVNAENDVPQNFSSKCGKSEQAQIGHERGKSSSLRLTNISQGQQQLDGDKSTRSGSKMTDIQTGTIVMANYHLKPDRDLQETNCNESYKPDERSFHDNRNDDAPVDHTKIYCEEGTPVCFSRVSSLSSLHSSEATDKQDKRPQGPLKKIEEKENAMHNSTVKMQPATLTPNSFRQKSEQQSELNYHHNEKEQTTITNDKEHMQETPMMFSRSTSLGSLSSFDTHSVHSLVFSEYSKQASEVVSPSELPGSASETMPPSPRGAKSSDHLNKKMEMFPCSTFLQKFTTNINANSEGISPLTRCNVDKPVNYDAGLFKSEAPVVYADEGTPPIFSDNLSELSAITSNNYGINNKTIVDDERNNHVLQQMQYIVQQLTKSESKARQNVASGRMARGSPMEHRIIRSDNKTERAHSKSFVTNTKSVLSGKEMECHMIGQSNEDQSLPYDMKQTKDEVRNYLVMDMPMCFSKCSSLSSGHDLDIDVNRKPKETKCNRKPAVDTDKLASKDESTAYTVEHTPICFLRNGSLTSSSVHSDDDDDPSDIALLQDCINSALPPCTRPYRNKIKCHNLSLSSCTETDVMTSNKSGRDNYSSINNESVKINAFSGDEVQQLGSHYSRIWKWKQTSKSKEKVFQKLTIDVKSQPCGRSRSQDSEKHLKDLSNQQIINLNAHRGSFDSLTFPTGAVVNTTVDIEKHQQESICVLQNLMCSIEHDVRKLNRSTDKSDDNESEKSPFEEQNFFMTCSGTTEISVESIGKQLFPGNIVPHNDLMDSTFIGSQQIDVDVEMGHSSCETTLMGENITKSLNSTLTVSTGKRSVMGMTGNLTSEDKRALAGNTNVVMSEMMVNRMLVSGASMVDDENFMENETLALLANEYVCDTASAGSVTLSAASDLASECSSDKTEFNSQMSRRARILKYGEMDQIHYERETEVKAIRGKRKPLYSSKSVSSPSHLTKLPDKNRVDNVTGVAHNISPRTVPGAPSPSNTSESRKIHNLRTMPQASSTPVKSNCLSKPCFNESSRVQKTPSFEHKNQNFITVSATTSSDVYSSNDTSARILTRMPDCVSLNKTSSGSNVQNVEDDAKVIKSSFGTFLDHIDESELVKTGFVNSLKQNSHPVTPVNLNIHKVSSGIMVTTKQDDSLKQTEKKTVTSKFAGLWKSEKAEEKSKMQIISMLAFAKRKMKNGTVKEQEVKKKEPSPKKSLNRNICILNGSIAERVCNSSTYDKLNVTNDKSQIPSHGHDEHDVRMKSETSNTLGCSNSSKTKSMFEQNNELNKIHKGVSTFEIGVEYNLDDARVCSIEQSIEVMSRSIEDNTKKINSFYYDTVDTCKLDLTGSPAKRNHPGTWTKKNSHNDFVSTAEETCFAIPLVKKSESLNFQTHLSVLHLYDYENDNNVWIGQDDNLRSSDVTKSRNEKKGFGGTSSFLNVVSKMFGVSKKSGDKQDKSFSTVFKKHVKTKNESNAKVKREKDNNTNKMEAQTSKSEAKLLKAEQKAKARQLKMQVKLNKSEIKASKKEAKLCKRRKSESSQYVDNTSQHLSSSTSLKKCSRFH